MLHPVLVEQSCFEYLVQQTPQPPHIEGGSMRERERERRGRGRVRGGGEGEGREREKRSGERERASLLQPRCT